jgi:hypothetical protein
VAPTLGFDGNLVGVMRPAGVAPGVGSGRGVNVILIPLEPMLTHQFTAEIPQDLLEHLNLSSPAIVA